MDARDTLLLACETSGSREALRSLFEDSFNPLEASNSHQARLFMEQTHNCIAAAILDITVASKINRGTLNGIEKISLYEDIPKVSPVTISLYLCPGSRLGRRL